MLLRQFATQLWASARSYSSKQLSSKVKEPGRGKTVVAGYQKTRTKPTTLDLGGFSRLSKVSLEARQTHNNLLSKVAQFSQLRISSSLRENLIKILPEGAVPTAIQKVAIKALGATKKNPMGSHSWLLAAETGSGKSLAYLLPVLSKLQDTQEQYGRQRAVVRGLVIVPSWELVDQVGSIVRALAPDLRIYATSQSGGLKMAKQVARGLDLLVCTPNKLESFIKREESLADRALSNCQYVVVDEADSLWKIKCKDMTDQILSRCSQRTDTIFVSATIPREFDRQLRKDFPEMTRLVTPNIHRLPRHIDFRIVRTQLRPYNGNKSQALMQTLYAIYYDHTEPNLRKRAVVFVNNKSSVNNLVKEISEAGYPVSGYSGDIDPAERASLLGKLTESPVVISDSDKDRLEVLVCTDLAARGIDMKKVRNIILWDMPTTASDLIHRAGRTGRLGSSGRVILLVSKQESQGWLKGFETVVRKGEALA